MSFIDARLDMGYDYGAEGGRSWNTSVITLAGGRSIRNQNWQDWIGRWQLGNRVIDKAQLDYLASFHARARGMLHTFRYKDWNDYELIQGLQTVADGQIQLAKTYGAGAPAYVCPITLPVDGTLVIQHSADGIAWSPWTEGADYSADYTTGVVTLLDSPPPAPAYVRASCEFDVRVRFDVDVLAAHFLAYEQRGDDNQRAYQLGSVSVQEVLL